MYFNFYSFELQFLRDLLHLNYSSLTMKVSDFWQYTVIYLLQVVYDTSTYKSYSKLTIHLSLVDDNSYLRRWPSTASSRSRINWKWTRSSPLTSGAGATRRSASSAVVCARSSRASVGDRAFLERLLHAHFEYDVRVHLYSNQAYITVYSIL